MNDKTRADVEELIDALQDLGWGVDGYDVREEDITTVSGDSHPISASITVEAERHYSPQLPEEQKP